MIGQTVSHYKILEKLGEGGMGVVYKAQDTKLDRTVALKFLPARLSGSEQDRARFTQEAKAASALNHPNVCTIHDIQEHEGQMFMVMEFVDGQTLRERMPSLSLKQAMDIGIQIADGLAAAHEKGIVHRDIKPENIMLRKDGIAQIMDFGLAKLREGGSKITRLTKEGSTVGTAGYMSPEQVQGQNTDHRSDIFSFGVVLYEMMAGQLPFRGVHETALAYEIVNVDPPPMSSIKPEIDPGLDAVVLECLAKESSERCQSVAEVAKDLRRIKRETSKQQLSRTYPARTISKQSQQAPEAIQPPATARSRYFPWGVAGVFILATVFLILRQFSAQPERQTLLVSSIMPPDSVYIHSFGQSAGPATLSPDGSTIVFEGVTRDGIKQLYLRPLNSGAAKPIEGTKNAQYPFWSPDGKFIGFFANGKIKKIETTGNSPLTICDAPNPRGGTWSGAGFILFSSNFQTPVSRVSADGGTPEEITRLDSTRGESSHRWPSALPDGKHFLFFARTSANQGSAEGHAIYVASVDGKTSKLLMHASSNAIYASGYILYVQSSVLMARQFDESSLELKGDAVPVAENVLDDPGFNLSAISASQTGLLVFQSGHAQSGAKLLLMDRAGNILSTVGESIEHFRVRFSFDDRHILASIFDAKLLRLNVWMYELNSGGKNRLTSGLGEDSPVISPDGSKIVYSSLHDATSYLMQENLSSRTNENLGIDTLNFESGADWSPDGSYVLYAYGKPMSNRSNLWIMKTGGKHERSPFHQSTFNEFGGRISRDGKWIAYVSDESGENEIYLRPLNGTDGQDWKVSNLGGAFPRWGGNNTELFYVNNNNQLVLVSLQYKENAVSVVKSTPLFNFPIFTESYDVSHDGKKIVVCPLLERQKSTPLTLMTHWDAELKKN